jgi:flagellar protein FliS
MSPTVRDRYVTDSVTTASPARLVTMLYDALVRDLVIAEQAAGTRDYAIMNDRLLHAQDILIELGAALDTTAWEGGPALAQLYSFLIRELIAANVAKDGAKVQECRHLIEPLQDAWHQAANQLGAGA